MNSMKFITQELTAALSRGVRQLVWIGSPPLSLDIYPPESVRTYAVAEHPLSDLAAAIVLTDFSSEPLAGALKKSSFDQLTASLFVWVGGTAYRTIETVLATLAFVASLPKGSGVLLDYAGERTAAGSSTPTTLDPFASSIGTLSGKTSNRIQRQAVAALLRCAGFQQVTDLARAEPAFDGQHLVSACV